MAQSGEGRQTPASVKGWTGDALLNAIAYVDILDLHRVLPHHHIFNELLIPELHRQQCALKPTVTRLGARMAEGKLNPGTNAFFISIHRRSFGKELPDRTHKSIVSSNRAQCPLSGGDRVSQGLRETRL